MKKLIIGALALAGVAVSMPASAQGVYIGAGPVGVGVGVGPGYGYGYDRGYYDRGYGPGYRSYAYSAVIAASSDKRSTDTSGVFATAGKLAESFCALKASDPGPGSFSFTAQAAN